MSCDAIQPQIIDYIENTLDQQDKSIIEAHIAGCISCQDEIESLRKIIELPHTVEFDIPPQAYWNNYLPRLREKIDAKQKAPWYIRMPKYAWAGATAVIIFGILVLNFSELFQSSEQLSINEEQWMEIYETTLSNMEQSDMYSEEVLENEQISEFEQIILDDDWEQYKIIFEEKEINVEDEIEKMTDEELKELLEELKKVDII